MQTVCKLREFIPMTHQNVAYSHVVQSAPFAVVSALTIVKFQIPYRKFGIKIGITSPYHLKKNKIPERGNRGGKSKPGYHPG